MQRSEHLVISSGRKHGPGRMLDKRRLRGRFLASRSKRRSVGSLAPAMGSSRWPSSLAAARWHRQWRRQPDSPGCVCDPLDRHIHRLSIGPADLLRNRPTQTTGFSRHCSRQSRRTTASSPPHWRHVHPLALIVVAQWRNRALPRRTQEQRTARRYGASSTFAVLSMFGSQPLDISYGHRKTDVGCHRCCCRSAARQSPPFCGHQ